MDSISQGIVGSVASLNTLPGKVTAKLVACVVLGFLSGMAPDLDILIRSPSDPLLYLEYHRGFTHSLLFIPAGGALCAVVLHQMFRTVLTWKESYAICTAGYATHGLLDACTSYGTQLFWPFSDTRVAWNTISIIDPLFTVPLIALVALCYRSKCIRWARIAALYGLCYLALGYLQWQRAVDFGEQLARSRGHQPTTVEAKPSFGNIALWKIVYRASDSYYIDAVHLLGQPLHFPGDAIPLLDLQRDFPHVTSDSTTGHDIERFRWFSRGYLAVHPDRPSYIIDVRYSLVPNEIRPLWGIQVPENTALHTPFEMMRDVSGSRRNKFLAMLLRRVPAATTLSPTAAGHRSKYRLPPHLPDNTLEAGDHSHLLFVTNLIALS